DTPGRWWGVPPGAWAWGPAPGAGGAAAGWRRSPEIHPGRSRGLQPSASASRPPAIPSPSRPPAAQPLAPLVVARRRACRTLGLVGASEVRQIHRASQARETHVPGTSHTVPETAIVYREVAGLGLDADFPRIRAVPDEVRLAEAHRPESLAVAAGEQAQASVVARAVVEVEPDVQLLLRHAAVEEIAQPVGMPAETRVHAAGDVQVAIEHHPVLLAVADARALADQAD